MPRRGPDANKLPAGRNAPARRLADEAGTFQQMRLVKAFRAIEDQELRGTLLSLTERVAQFGRGRLAKK